MDERIDSIIEGHRAWIENSGIEVFERYMPDLESHLVEGTAQAFQVVPIFLDGLGLYYGTLGITEILGGSQSGWQHIATSLDFWGWSLKVCAESYFRNMGTNPLNLTGNVTYAACLACVSEKWSELAIDILHRVEHDLNSVHQGYWKSRKFEPFVLQCFDFENGSALTKPIDEPYASVFEHWTDEDKLAGSLEAVCDYHCRNLEEDTSDWDPEFKRPPFDLLPCEVMLVDRVRRKLGMKTPRINHQLVDVLGYVPAVPPGNTEHDVLQKLSIAFDECFR